MRLCQLHRGVSCSTGRNRLSWQLEEMAPFAFRVSVAGFGGRLSELLLPLRAVRRPGADQVASALWGRAAHRDCSREGMDASNH